MIIYLQICEINHENYKSNTNPNIYFLKPSRNMNSSYVIFFSTLLKNKLFCEYLDWADCCVFLFHVLLFFFFSCAWTVTSHGFTVQETKITIHILFITVHALKNIKNRSHDTIHTFKNYFTTVLSIFNFQFQQQAQSKRILYDFSCIF